MANEPRRPKLPACKECSQKKIKCDSNRPRCRWCARSNLDCIVLDSVNQEWISRSYIDELERKEAALWEPEAIPRPEPVAGAAANGGAHETPTSQLASVPSVGGCSSTVTRGGGLNFITLLFSDAEWTRTNADLLRTLATAPRGPHTTIEACALPSSPVVVDLFKKYLSWCHVLCPFLLRQEVWDLHQRVFSADRVDAVDSHDLFQTFIICAIGSVIPYHNGTHPQHPEGYYRAALLHLDSHFLTRGLESIQDLLLICRFGVYHHIGISIWDIVRLCSRLCTEQGLHCGDGEGTDALHSQKRRRVFWQVYVMDRYSSTTLDRPFSIDDRDIDVGFPTDRTDDELGPPETIRDAAEPSELTIFLFCVRLRRITSQIHTDLLRLRQETGVYTQPHLAVGRIYTTLNSLLQELLVWRSTAPLIQNPQCLYESQDWFDLIYSREKMALVRRTVDIVPKTTGAPPGHILALFLNTALETIERYASLFRRKHVIHTRSYFHTLFTAGLSVVYCVSVSSNFSLGDSDDVARGLHACQDALSSMSLLLPDFSSYVTVFEALCRHTVRTVQHDPSVEFPDTTKATALPDSFRQDHHAAGFRPGMFPSASYTNITSGHDWAQNPHLEVPVQLAGGPSNVDARNGGPPHDDLLQWAFANDESIWNMDMMLGECVYGESNNTYFFDGMNIL